MTISRNAALAALLWTATGCAPVDTDGDGLTDDLEEEFGTNINKTDTDGDGLSDMEEYELGTDGTDWDSDGDGYGDYDEVAEGHDPLDADDGIYAGGWPYNPYKDEVEDPGWDSEAGEGATAPEFIAVDQYGEMVNLYDFANQGVPVVLDLGTKWCTPCKGLAHYLATGDSSEIADYPWWDEANADLHERVANGELYWITVLFSTSESSGPATGDDATEWHESYENPVIPVLADTDLLMHDYLDIQSFPALSMLDADMRFVVFSNQGPYEVMGLLEEGL